MTDLVNMSGEELAARREHMRHGDTYGDFKAVNAEFARRDAELEALRQRAEAAENAARDAALLFGHSWQQSLQAVNGNHGEFFPHQLAQVAAENEALRQQVDDLAKSLDENWVQHQQVIKSRHRAEAAERERDRYLAMLGAEYAGASAARNGDSIEACPYGPNKPDGFRDAELRGFWQRGHDHVTRAKAIKALTAQLATAKAALESLTKGMDREGADGVGMPECPWCHADDEQQSDGAYRHETDCELQRARDTLAALDTANTKGSDDE
jgi:small-conductance mechanosensitive channel